MRDRSAWPYGARVRGESLAAAATEEQFAAVHKDEARLRPGVMALCRRLIPG